jgi:hypothetical protein
MRGSQQNPAPSHLNHSEDVEAGGKYWFRTGHISNGYETPDVILNSSDDRKLKVIITIGVGISGILIPT